MIVTGSRLIRQGLSSPTPVTSMSATELQTMQPQSLIQALAELPSLTDSTTSRSIGANSVYGPGSFVNLRNLGPDRTLVLLDGHRVTPTNVEDYVDVDMLPQALISSVNVVTGGASAAYGSDAVAGVVDFKLDTHFTGLKVEGSGGVSGVGDGQYYKASIAWGGKFLGDRLHVIASYDRLTDEHAYADNRGWSSANCAIIPIPGVTTTTESATNPRQKVACGATLPYANEGGAITSGPLTTATQGITFGPGGVVEPFNFGTQRSSSYMVGGSGEPLNQDYNFQPRITNNIGFLRIGYDVTPDIEAYVQSSIGFVKAEYDLTSPNFFTPRPFTIYSGNPYIPASIQAQMTAQNIPSFQLGIVPSDWGLEDLYSNYTNFDVTGGLQGKFGRTWHWDLSYEHGETDFDLNNTGNIKLENLFRSLDAVTGPGGQIVCRSSLTNPTTSVGCVPLNPFGPGAASKQALSYVQGDLLSGNRIVQDDVEASLHGDLFSLWAGPVSVAVGGDWRRIVGSAYSDALSQETSLNFDGVRGVPASVLAQSGGWVTNNPKPANGEQSVAEGFAEILVPLLRDLPFAHSADFNGAIRVTDYSTSGTVTTWKAGLTWRPVNDILLRATDSRDIRAPNINDLFAGATTTPATVTDPFNGQQSYNIHTITAGNSKLVPESADTFTTGITYNSSIIRGFGMSIDYYDINIKNVISNLAAQDEINECFAGATSLCSLLQRDSTGTLVNVLTPALNLSGLRSRGIDFEFDYRRPLSAFVSSWDGRLSVRLFGNRLMEQATTTPTLTGTLYVNRVGDMSQGNPGWQFNVLTTVETGPYGFDVTGRFIGSGVINATYHTGDIADNSVPSVFTLDLGARYTFKTAPGHPQVFLKITNVLDQAPPIVPAATFYGGPTDSMVYDTLGRFFSFGVRARF